MLGLNLEEIDMDSAGWAPQCRDGKGERCPERATVRIHAPDGQEVPGCWMCTAHAAAVVAEYAEKLGETWTTTPYAAK